MKDQLVNFLNDLKKRKDIFNFSEAQTKQSIILYVLNLLGWNPFNSEEIRPEYGVAERRVDYALHLFNSPKVFIEVKKVDEILSNHEEQLVSYATIESVKLAILTNGITWWFYLPLVEGIWDQKKFYIIDVMEQETSQAAEKFFEFLSKQNTSSGEAITKAEAIFRDKKKYSVISESLPIAWNRLILGIDETLVQLLKENTEKLCGYDIEDGMVIQFLEQYQNSLTIGKEVKNKPILTSIRTREIIERSQLSKAGRGKDRKLRVEIDWQKVGKQLPVEVLEHDQGTKIFLDTLEKIAKQVGFVSFQKLLNYRVNRGMLLATERDRYHRGKLLNYYVLTYNSTNEKAAILRKVTEILDLPLGFISIEVL